MEDGPAKYPIEPVMALVVRQMTNKEFVEAIVEILDRMKKLGLIDFEYAKIK